MTRFLKRSHQDWCILRRSRERSVLVGVFALACLLAPSGKTQTYADTLNSDEKKLLDNNVDLLFRAELSNTSDEVDKALFCKTKDSYIVTAYCPKTGIEPEKADPAFDYERHTLHIAKSKIETTLTKVLAEGCMKVSMDEPVQSSSLSCIKEPNNYGGSLHFNTVSMLLGTLQDSDILSRPWDAALGSCGQGSNCVDSDRGIINHAFQCAASLFFSTQRCAMLDIDLPLLGRRSAQQLIQRLRLRPSSTLAGAGFADVLGPEVVGNIQVDSSVRTPQSFLPTMPGAGLLQVAPEAQGNFTWLAQGMIPTGDAWVIPKGFKGEWLPWPDDRARLVITLVGEVVISMTAYGVVPSEPARPRSTPELRYLVTYPYELRVIYDSKDANDGFDMKNPGRFVGDGPCPGPPSKPKKRVNL